MLEFIPIDLNIHKTLLIDLSDEYLFWIADELKKQYNMDLVSILEKPIRDYAKESVQELTSYKPPNGEFYIVKVEDKIIGMGAFRKLREDIGEVKRMYIRREFRGEGYVKRLLNHLLEIGKKFDCLKILLDTGKFMKAAQHVYHSAGFHEIQEYSDTEVPLKLRPYWLYMEKEI
jgi:ribosomal protein S18 acetylase RimI-like enzyme